MIVITGPTASGKSALAVEVARRLGTEVISADSRQIYHGIPIVTAVPTIEERGGVPHHLIETLPLNAYYSASEFERDALRLAGEIMERTGNVVVCGGSMLYIDALCHGIDELPTVSDSIRLGLEKELRVKGEVWLRSELRRLDPEYHDKVDLKNVKRVFHAVEIIRASGKTYSGQRTGRRIERSFPIVKVLLEAPRELLFDRINHRVEAMVDHGLEEEACRVYPMRHLNSLNTVGLKEMFAWFEGRMDFLTAVARIQKNTRVYAKKQILWWSRRDDMHRLDIRSDGLADLVCGLV